MDKFLIDNTDFGIGNISFSIDDKESLISELIIEGDEAIFRKLAENEEGEWSWAVYPPKLKFEEVPIESEGHIEFTVDDDLLDECDISLYMMQHFDFYGEVLIKGDMLTIEGSVDMSGNELPLKITIEHLTK